jgi:hypothetical protein
MITYSTVVWLPISSRDIRRIGRIDEFQLPAVTANAALIAPGVASLD